MKSVIRELSIEDFDLSMKLGEYAFNITLSDEQRQKQKDGFINHEVQRFGLFEGDVLCSQLKLHHFQFMIQGKAIQGSGVAFVSTWPEFRRNGYVAQLIQHSFAEMRARNQTISLLHPFSIGFYRKYGYELLSQRVKNSMPITYIKRTQVSGNVTRETSFDELIPIYNEYSKSYNGMLVRSYDIWENFFINNKKSHTIIYRNEEQAVRGYLVYDLDRQQQSLKVLECITLDKQAYLALWSFIGQHDSMVRSVEWYTPYSDYQFAELEDPRITREVEQYGMVRIVDCIRFIEQYTFRSTINSEVEYYSLLIEDEHASWNNGLFQLTVDATGKGSLTKENNQNLNMSSTIKLNINTLSGLLLGYYTMNYLVWNEHITGDNNNLHALADRIGHHNTQLLNYF